MPRFASLKHFLERAPLYTALREHLPQNMEALRVSVIDQYCQNERAIRPFRIPGTSRLGVEVATMPKASAPTATRLKSGIHEIEYVCTACETARLRMWVDLEMELREGTPPSFTLKAIRKVGQWPAWMPEQVKEIQDFFGVHAVVFAKGLACESQGYGIGAYGYYRRIVEDVIDALLASVIDLIPEMERAQYAAALEATATSRVAQEKIALVKDLLPGTLRPDGINPLSVLHSALSGGLHSEPDETCLVYATEIRESLTFLVRQVAGQKEASRRFTDSMRRLLTKIAGPASGSE